MKKTNKKQKELIIKDDGVLSSYSYVFGDEFELNNDISGMYYILEELCSHFDHLYYDASLTGIEIITKNSELKKEIKDKLDIICDKHADIANLIHKVRDLVCDTDDLIQEFYNKYSDNIANE